MMKVLLLALLLPACVVGSDGGQTPGDDDEPGPGPGPDDPSGIAGNITTDTTFSGVVQFSGATTIDPGVTVTVSEGATLNFGAASNLSVKGTLNVAGTKASPVTIQPDPDAASPSQFFGGMNISGTLTMTYGVQRGGSIVTVAGGSATITDTKMFGATGDFLIMNGGTVNVTYSQLGADAGTTDTTHCNLHFGGSGNMITLTNNNIIGTPFGLMFYGGQLANFQNNNWEENATAAADWIDSQPGVSGDFSGGFFSAGVPTAKAGATFTVNTPSATRLTDAGVR
ncbi:MAG: hypothetical protein H0V17_06175 [Deltaproteobacteria bacterium]|nr:hypothetical protein [Deltaproteobacteria bacterium]